MEQRRSAFSQGYVAIIGGVNIDIRGQSVGPLVPRDSNPGHVSSSLGGVGRNIAHNAALLGIPVHFLSALGDDDNGRRVEASCKELGICLDSVRRIPGGRTSTYVYLAGPDGDMALAVSDMEICREITPEYLGRNLSLLNGAAAVVCDANVPAQTIHFLAERCTAPIFADPVSTVKAEKLRPVLGKLHTLKPNQLEAELLSGVSIKDRTSLVEAARVLLGTGLKRVFISMGSRGVYAADRSGAFLVPCKPSQLVNATGAGDAFMAGLLWAHMSGLSLEQAANAGLAASSIAIEGKDTINPSLSEAALLSRMAVK